MLKWVKCVIHKVLYLYLMNTKNKITYQVYYKHRLATKFFFSATYIILLTIKLNIINFIMVTYLRSKNIQLTAKYDVKESKYFE